MNVALAGGTGFIGKVVLRKLIEAGHHVKALIRPGSLLKIVKFSHMESSYVYYDSPSQLFKIVEGCGALINLVGIIKETKDNTFDFAHHTIPLSLATAARDAGIKRFIQMSALGVESDIETEYFESKRLGEMAVKNSNLDWTIFRPAVVFGPEDHLVNMLAKTLKWAPCFPVIGDGQYKFQPVHVENVADGFVMALEKPETIGKTYEIAGPDIYTFDQMLEMIGQAGGKKHVRKIHMPLWIIKTAIKLFGRIMPGPLSMDTLKMMLAGSTSNDDTYFKTFDTTPITFREGIAQYLKK